MMLTRWNRNFPLLRLGNEMDRAFFGELFDSFQNGFEEDGGRLFPAVNVWEDERTIHAECELPGMRMEDVEVSVLGDELTIKGQHRVDESDKGPYFRRERAFGAFSRAIRLPVDVNPDKVQATLRDGILTITLPKAETAVPRKINVKVS